MLLGQRYKRYLTSRESLRESACFVADGEQRHNSFRAQPSDCEADRVDRARVEPLGIVDEAQYRPLLGRLGKQCQGSQPDQHSVRGSFRLHPERRSQRSCLRRREPVCRAHQRVKQLMKAGIWKLRLRFDSGHVQGKEIVAGATRRLLEQGGLANASFPTDDHSATTRALASRREQLDDVPQLSVAPDEH